MSIIPAKELSAVTTEDIVNMFCDKLMEEIQAANADGQRKTCFWTSAIYLQDGKLVSRYSYTGDADIWSVPCYRFDDYHDAIASKFREAGYTIQPTGFIGGVWQQTEDIIW